MSMTDKELAKEAAEKIIDAIYEKWDIGNYDVMWQPPARPFQDAKLSEVIDQIVPFLTKAKEQNEDAKRLDWLEETSKRKSNRGLLYVPLGSDFKDRHDLRAAIDSAMNKQEGNAHVWSQSPGDVPCIGFVPRCINCDVSSESVAADSPCRVNKQEEGKK